MKSACPVQDLLVLMPPPPWFGPGRFLDVCQEVKSTAAQLGPKYNIHSIREDEFDAKFSLQLKFSNRFFYWQRFICLDGLSFTSQSYVCPSSGAVASFCQENRKLGRTLVCDPHCTMGQAMEKEEFKSSQK